MHALKPEKCVGDNESANSYNERVILNINKHQNWTSYDVVAKTKSTLKLKKVGHAGTLDPLATGVLVVLTGKDTKKQQDIMKATKEYVFEVAFGAETPTYDLEDVPTFSNPKITLEEIKTLLPTAITKYTGKFVQTAPAYSAKKIKGVPLYKKARKGEKITDLPKKEVEVFSFDILDIFEKEVETDKGPQVLSMLKAKVTCSSGTYVRSLAHDLGQDLKTGAVLTSLVRTKVGDYIIEDSVSIEDLENLRP